LENLLNVLYKGGVTVQFHYEIYIVGEEGMFYSFESFWRYDVNNRLFVEIDGTTYSLIVTRMTHQIVDHIDVHRLTCHKKVYEPK